MGNALVSPSRIRTAASLGEPSAGNGSFPGSADSALCALTDFQHHYPITVDIHCCLEEALAEMHRWEVHALLVTHQESDGMNLQVVGLITHSDIDRRNRRRESAASGGDDGIVRVGEVMTSWDELALVRYEALTTIAAANLHHMFQGTGLTHLLVVEFRDDDSVVARGLLSRAALSKRLKRASSGSRIKRGAPRSSRGAAGPRIRESVSEQSPS